MNENMKFKVLHPRMLTAAFNDAFFNREDLRKWYDNETVYQQQCGNFLSTGSFKCNGKFCA